jgi:hypothetical protein
VDVGRKWNVAYLLKNAKEIFDGPKLEQSISELPPLQHFGLENNRSVRPREHQPFANRHLASGPHQRVPAVFACGFGEHHLNPSRRFLFLASQRPSRVKPRRNHPAVVKHKQVAFAKKGREFAELAVSNFAAVAIHHQHAAGAAFSRGFLRDQLLRQMIVEIADEQIAHGVRCPKCSYARMRARSSAAFKS